MDTHHVPILSIHAAPLYLSSLLSFMSLCRAPLGPVSPISSLLPFSPFVLDSPFEMHINIIKSTPHIIIQP